MKNGEIQTFLKCDYFSIEINKEGLKEETSLANSKLKERLLAYKDLCYIDIIYSNKEESIYVPWNDEFEYHNEYQTIELIDDNTIKVVIKEPDNKINK